jgi:hypothetical protein
LEERFSPGEICFEHVDLNFVSLKELLSRRFHILGIDVKWEEGSEFKEAIQKWPIGGLASAFFVAGSFISALEKGMSFVADAIHTYLPGAYIIYGEPEPAVSGLVESYLGRRPVATVPNLIELDNETRHPREKTDLSKIWHQSYQYTKEMLKCDWYTYYVETSRGCPHGRCGFCIENKMSAKGWRGYPLENVLSVFSDLNQAGIDYVFIYDKDFWGNDRERAQELARALIGAGNKVNFTAALRADAIIRGEHLLGDFRKAGLRSVFMGAESFSNSVLERFQKGITAEDNLKAIQILRKHALDFVMGSIVDPLESLEELIESLRVIRRNQLEGHLSRVFNPMEIRSGVNYETILRELGLLGEMGENLVYQYDFRDERVAEVMSVAEAWFRETPQVNFLLIVAKRMLRIDSDQACMEYEQYQRYFRMLNGIGVDFMLNVATAVKAGRQRSIAQIKAQSTDLYRGVVRALTNALRPDFNVSRNIIEKSKEMGYASW